MSIDYKKRIADTLFLHPRVEHQKIGETAEDREKIAAEVPTLLPFEGKEYAHFLPVLDWDHRLPSNRLILRLYSYYTEDAYALGKADLDARLSRIRKMDRFPEFDVPDFADMLADESYEIVLDSKGTRKSSRLTSTWRRELAADKASLAVSVVRQSRDFAKINRQFRNRPENLGEAEAVSWTPPCESGYERWTMDVWYLVAYDGMHGKGRSFLVDLEQKRVVAVREFTVRPD